MTVLNIIIINTTSETLIGVHSTMVEWATHMRVYAGSSPIGADHREELIAALSYSLNDVK